MDKNRKKGLVIIPAYNEQGAIAKTVENIVKNAPSFDYIVMFAYFSYFGTYVW